MLIVLLPAARVLDPERRESLLKVVRSRFRWVAWSVVLLLIGSGVYDTSLVWEAPWGKYWSWLTIKIGLSMVVFLIVLCLTIPLKILAPLHERRGLWLSLAFALAMAVILISAYLRRG